MKKLLILIAALAFSVAACAQATAPKISGDEHWDFAFDSSNSVNGPVYAIAAGETGIYVGGSFTKAGNTTVSNIALWDGTQWLALGAGVYTDGDTAVVRAIAVKGSDVYVGGSFASAGMGDASNVARWDGSAWHELGNGTDAMVRALAVDSLGALYAGGDFSNAGSLTGCGKVAKWDGTQWLATGNGFSGFPSETRVNSLIASGLKVVAGGNFLISGSDSLKYLAQWNGSSWQPHAGGTNGEVYDLDYKGTVLYAGGKFTKAGTVSAKHIATLNGSTWSAIAGGVDYPPLSLDYGQYDVYVASGISLLPAVNITKFDCCWDPLGSGANDTVFAVCTNGADVWIGGKFTSAGAKPSWYFGHWNPNVVFVGVDELSVNQDFKAWPNPASDRVTLCVNSSTSGDAVCNIYNTNGARVQSSTMKLNNGRNEVLLDISALLPGPYFIEVCSVERIFKTTILVK